MFGQEVLNTALQSAFVFGVSALAWVIFARKKAGYVQWIGLGSPASGWIKPTLITFAIVAGASALAMLLPGLSGLVQAEGTVGGRFAETGLTPVAFATILLVAFVKTGFTEELFFRGLIGKRLINWLGFARGNLLQAAIFGAIHLLIFVVPGAPDPTFASLFVMFFVPGGAGWAMGYANEKFGGGTIWPGWLMHGLGNFVAYTMMAIG
ncbi:CPBP family intramembrane glutamic endopeptidase [Sphingomicrobium sediminis]|uniref:CPBP family intramembrane metalloprotease n=1 Tax=Sphingomicrobium sediminis TaxID=2950949 RepID=A0A9X2J3L3_9SPHN|nr:CPBP family intramembrane glutamic endopeptidase [Sphingomicrobium sediminis]MCM8557426.1 CPBP family intramembrane metalloprotease [Sphingomicrobium sediminis]